MMGGKLTTMSPLALLIWSAELGQRSEYIRCTYRYLATLQFLSDWGLSNLCEIEPFLTRGVLLPGCYRGCCSASCTHGIVQHVGASAHGCGPMESCRASASIEAGMTGSESLICQDNFVSHQGQVLESVTFQLTTIISGFACPDWKDSLLNVDDASEWFCCIKIPEQVCFPYKRHWITEVSWSAMEQNSYLLIKSCM